MIFFFSNLPDPDRRVLGNRPDLLRERCAILRLAGRAAAIRGYGEAGERATSEEVLGEVHMLAGGGFSQDSGLRGGDDEPEGASAVGVRGESAQLHSGAGRRERLGREPEDSGYSAGGAAPEAATVSRERR